MSLIESDLVFLNGKIVTVDTNNSIQEAVAVKGKWILKVGSNEDVRKFIGDNTKVIDLKRRTVLPGFNDSHEHCMRKGLQSDYVDCSSPPMRTIGDIVEALSEKAEEKEEGEWIIGSWFDDSKLSEGRFPTRYDLDEASDKNPIYLGRAGGHNAVANSLALEIAGIDENTSQPSGGHIGKDEKGVPTGRLDEIAAMDLVRNQIPKPTPEKAVEMMMEHWPILENELLSWGITTVHEAHIKALEAQAYLGLLENKKLNLRVGLMLDGMQPYGGYATQDLSRQGLRTGFGYDDVINVIGVKVGVDGAMGSLTAALTEPYNNDPDNYGIIRVDSKELTNEVVECHKSGLRVCIHAIGDRAIDLALDAIEEALRQKSWDNHRHRIEHAGYVRPDQLMRMKKLGVFISASIGFCYPIGDSHIDALGVERLEGYYPMRSFLDHEIITGGNSDGFGDNWVLMGIYGCITRKSMNGQSLSKSQKISIMDAIKVYTINGAYLEGTEKIKGTIESGKLADMIVFDEDVLQIDPEKILKLNCVMTVVGGKIVYHKNN